MTDILIYVEDPGSANYLATLPSALTERELKVKIFCEGKARDVLQKVGTPFIEPNESAEALLERTKPRLVLVGTAENPNSLGLSLIAAGKKKNIPTVGAVDAFMNASFRFAGGSKDPLKFAPDFLLVPDEGTKKQYMDLGFLGENINICGHPHYNYVLSRRGHYGSKKELRARLFPEAHEKIVMFVSEHTITVDPASSLKSADYTLNGRGYSKERTKIVLEEFLDALDSDHPPFVVLRLHPKDNASNYKEYMTQINAISQGGDPLEIVQAADLVVGLTTTLLLEASLLDIPTLSIVPRLLEREWLASVRSGNTICVHERSQLQKVLPQMLKDSENTKSLLPSPEGSTTLVVKTLERILHD